MARQVSGSEKSLLDAIRDGDVVRPALMRWQAWLQWRKGDGMRPTAARDGTATTSLQESALWKAVMNELYGDEWSLTLAAEEGTPLHPLEPSTMPAEGAEQPQQSLEPSTVPAEDADANAGLLTPRPGSQRSPGSGDIRTGAAEGPGSGHGSPQPSWSSQNPGTPTRLNVAIGKPYLPATEVLDRYVERVTKQAIALEALGQPLGEGVLEATIAKAAYELKIHEEAGGDSLRQLRLLKREYAFEIADLDGSAAQAGRINALEALLEARGDSPEELRSIVNQGLEVAPTPVRAAPSGLTLGPQSREPSTLPATLASVAQDYRASVAQFPMNGTGMDTPSVPNTAVDNQLAALEDRLRSQEAEMAAQKLHAAASTPGETLMAEAISNQTELLKAVLDKPSVPRSTIRVEPKVYWPKLGDDGTGGREVEEFYEKFEDICDLANNGSGMADKEMMVALKSCLHGSRRKIYDNVVKANKNLENSVDGPGEIYLTIKKRLFRFLETATEKQLRVANDWTNLVKGKHTTALQFEAEWEQVHADLVEVGLGKPPLEKFLAYIVKVGPPTSETIRMDRRPRKDGAGGFTTRLPETWEECHEVLCEIEGVKAGSKAFLAARAAGQSSVANDGPGPGRHDAQGGQWPDPKGKGKGKGKKGKDGGKGDGGKGGFKTVCYEFRDKGTCKYGDNCRYDHDAKVTGRTPTGALTRAAKKAQAAGVSQQQQPQQPQPKQPKGGNQQDPAAGGQGKDGAKGQGKDKKKILCRYIKKDQACPAAQGQCPYSHRKNYFDDKGKFVGRPKGKGKGRRGGGQDTDHGNAEEGWDQPVGLKRHGSGPQVIIRSGLGTVQMQEEKRKRADFVVESDKGLDHARAQVAAIVDALKTREGKVLKERLRTG